LRFGQSLAVTFGIKAASAATMLYSGQMAAITIKLPDDLAERLRNYEERLPEILELGLRGIEC
jgi:hypothetical protein